jgi:hypothetical protein
MNEMATVTALLSSHDAAGERNLASDKIKPTVTFGKQ